MLGLATRIGLLWAPGHSNIKGNDKADELAKSGASLNLLDPELALGTPFSLEQLQIILY